MYGTIFTADLCNETHRRVVGWFPAALQRGFVCRGRVSHRGDGRGRDVPETATVLRQVDMLSPEQEALLHNLLIIYLLSGSYTCGRLTPFRREILKKRGKLSYAIATLIFFTLWPVALLGMHRVHKHILKGGPDADKTGNQR